MIRGAMMARDARHVEGGQDAKERLLAFFEKELTSRNLESEGGDVEIQLLQKSHGMGEDGVDDFDYQLGRSLSDLVNEIVDAAESDALSYQGKTRYVVRIEGRSKHLMFTLKVPALSEDQEFDEFGDPDEPRNARGHLGQMMRHTEVFAKEMVSAARMGRDDIYKQNQALQAQVTALQKQCFENMKQLEELYSMDFARRLKLREVENEERRKEQALGMLMKAGPLLMSKVLGVEEQAPGGSKIVGSTPIEQLVESLVSSLESDPSKLESLGKVLSPIDLMTLSEIYARVTAKKQAEQQAAQQTAQQAEQQPNQTNGQTWPNANGHGGPGGFPFAHQQPGGAK